VELLLLAHPRGQLVDLHVVVKDADGDGTLGPVVAANVYAGGIPDRPGASLGLQGSLLLVRYSSPDRSCVGR
jgi:hypothetical protein